MWILKNFAGVFVTVYPSESGIGGYDLLSNSDNMFAFDYAGRGRRDHLVLYRPGSGRIWILKNRGGAFSPVYASNTTGIGGYDLKSGVDRVTAFDYAKAGIFDHLVLYRPGTGTIWILRHKAGVFSAVYAQGDPGTGIGGYDLASPLDKLFVYDYRTRGHHRTQQAPTAGDATPGVRAANSSASAQLPPDMLTLEHSFAATLDD